MALTDYTDYDSVRAALGVSVDELEDGTLALPLYEYALTAELDDISVSLSDTIDTVKAIDPSSRTSVEEKFLQAAQLFATYAVAKQLASSLPLFSPEQITDGKAAFRRNQDSPYKMVISAITSQYERFRTRVAELLALVTSSSGSTATAKVYFSVSVPSSDPVTGS